MLGLGVGRSIWGREYFPRATSEFGVTLKVLSETMCHMISAPCKDVLRSRSKLVKTTCEVLESHAD